MKSNSEVAHLWANQLCQSAKGSSFYFKDKTIYSYGAHFPIASFVTNDLGQEIILFTRDSYSNTTAKHISYARSACSHKQKLFIPEVEPYGGINHSKCFSLWLKEIERIKTTKLFKARKPLIYMEQIDAILDEAKLYAKFFGIELPKELINASNPLSVEKIEELKRKDKEYREQRKAIQRKREERLQAVNAEKIAKWLNGENVYLSHDIMRYQILRVKGDRIETSKGVKIPIEIAKRFYHKLIQSAICIGDAILGYRVDSIKGDIIKIGCHTFEISYLLNFGAQL